MSKSIIADKSFQFSVKIVKLCQTLFKEGKPFDLGRQLLKSGTSIGANIEEALGGQSNKDFIAKMHIAYKEARETHYWLRLLIACELVDTEEAEALLSECSELKRMSSSIIQTMKQKQKI